MSEERSLMAWERMKLSSLMTGAEVASRAALSRSVGAFWPMDRMEPGASVAAGFAPPRAGDFADAS
jgi:hypothetical protein